MRPIRQYGKEDEADFKNSMSKVHNIDTILIGARTCIGSPAWSGSVIDPGFVLTSAPAQFPHLSTL